MPKRKAVISAPPTSFRCPYCGAVPGKPCKTAAGRKLRNALGVCVAMVHVDRMEAAERLEAVQAIVRNGAATGGISGKTWPSYISYELRSA